MSTTAMAHAAFHPGQRVNWTEYGHWFSGRIVRQLTDDIVIKGKRLAASPAAPRWLVVTARGGHAAHPAEAIRDAAERFGVKPRGQADLFPA